MRSLVAGLCRHARTGFCLCALLIASIGAMAAAAAQTAVKLPPVVAKTMSGGKLPRSAVSIVVHAVDELAPRLEVNPSKPRNPASAIKLVTTWTALDLLGATHRWPTEVYLLGPLNARRDTVRGDIAIKGYGDPFLVIEEFWKLLGELRRQGIKKIEGDLVLDTSHYRINDPPPGAFDKRPYRLYNVRPNALL
ncbi:MAG: D-alanyl-D-alanine carboxypeptidase/D-alanyl-D-alanine-endopeptidase, partial [Chromatiales bacterium]|nr:D-alanyl-D-alanine carboxypeptidase/D-alanyl-D-alanine-endopeptidase [Chromatiales bacterium]